MDIIGVGVGGNLAVEEGWVWWELWMVRVCHHGSRLERTLGDHCLYEGLTEGFVSGGMD